MPVPVQSAALPGVQALAQALRRGRCTAPGLEGHDMTAPVDLVLSRLADPRQNGADRWRCACPVCGGRNRSTLSVGVGDTGAVLLKCWKEGCSPDQIARAVGLDLEDLFPPSDSHSPPTKRRRLISAGQALEVLEHELTLAIVCAADMARGQKLDKTTRDRLLQGAARVSLIRDEVRA